MRKIWCYLFSIPVNKLCRGTGWKFSRRFQVNEQELHSQQFFKRRAQRRTCCTLHSKGTRGVIITSLLRQNDVTMSFWRNNVVVTCIMLCVHWDYSDICSVETFLILHAAVYVSLQQKQHHRSALLNIYRGPARPSRKYRNLYRKNFGKIQDFTGYNLEKKRRNKRTIKQCISFFCKASLSIDTIHSVIPSCFRYMLMYVVVLTSGAF